MTNFLNLKLKKDGRTKNKVGIAVAKGMAEYFSTLGEKMHKKCGLAEGTLKMQYSLTNELEGTMKSCIENTTIHRLQQHN